MRSDDPSNEARDAARGRDAASPAGLPVRGWRDVLLRVKDNVEQDAVGLVAAGVAFYAFLSVFPAITALLSLYGLVADPGQAAQQVAGLRGAIPPAALELIKRQMTSVAASGGSSLGVGLAVSLALAIYSSSKGLAALITALNIMYHERERRGLIKLKALTLLLTFVAIVYLLVLLALIGATGVIGYLHLPAWLDIGVRGVCWLAVLLFMVGGLAMAYSLAPDRKRPRFAWASPGALVATLVWLAASAGFSIYLNYFGSFNKTYGSAAALVILMLWFWISAYAALAGAELNAALEGQTRRDSTAGRERPRGERGAVVADAVRESP